ncbi:MAG TPA: hypothetical protein VNV61_06965 [Steroidobacteraceae bacterium]|jgi:hypothetical protein|nr:hypothetical protein [Steroidobacteraceae bacterium]
MTIDDKPGGKRDSKFSFAVHELEQSAEVRELSVHSAPLKAANENRGFDPYNTSGSFDRKKNWMRVGKR